MSYTVQQLAKLAGISVRALHHYDEIGLLSPARDGSNGYRRYEEAELLKLQQIMFFRELEFALDEIKVILANPNFDMATALADHRKLIEIKRKRMDELISTIDNTLDNLIKNKIMDDKDLYDGFSKEESEAYAKEAKDRWGNTDAYKQSIKNYGRLTKEEKQKMKEDADKFMKTIVANMDKGPKSPEMQELIHQHYESLRFFYEPNLELYRNLATMYVDDSRYGAYYEKYREGLAVFMRDAMHAYCDAQEAKA